MKNRVLLAEDEVALGTIVKESLESRGFEVSICFDGEAAAREYEIFNPEILVLDVMMPKKDGFALAKEIREKDKHIPIIFLTAKSRTEDVVEGFGYGANDYIKKPFSMEELIVRIQALLSRKELLENQESYTIGNYTFDPSAQTLQLDSNIIQLTYRESQLLFELAKNSNKATERANILNVVWGNDDFFAGRSMDVFISKLRKKLSGDDRIEILNVRGIGYKLLCP